LTPAERHHRLFKKGATCAVVSPDGQAIYAGSGFGEIEAIGLNDLQRSATTFLPARVPVTALAATRDGKTLLVGTGNGRVFRYSSALEKMDDGRTHATSVLSLLSSGDGSSYRTGTAEGIFLEERE